MEFSKALFEEGVMGTGIAFPTVPEGKARVRTIVTAAHTKTSSRKRWRCSSAWASAWE